MNLRDFVVVAIFSVALGVFIWLGGILIAGVILFWGVILPYLAFAVGYHLGGGEMPYPGMPYDWQDKNAVIGGCVACAIYLTGFVFLWASFR